MKKTIAIILICSFIAMWPLSGCTRGVETINGKTYDSYGLLNSDTKDPNIRYEPMWWNMFVGVVFSELIIPPIYVFGFHCMEAAGPK